MAEEKKGTTNAKLTYKFSDLSNSAEGDNKPAYRDEDIKIMTDGSDPDRLKLFCEWPWRTSQWKNNLISTIQSSINGSTLQKEAFKLPMHIFEGEDTNVKEITGTAAGSINPIDFGSVDPSDYISIVTKLYGGTDYPYGKTLFSPKYEASGNAINSIIVNYSSRVLQDGKYGAAISLTYELVNFNYNHIKATAEDNNKTAKMAGAVQDNAYNAFISAYKGGKLPVEETIRIIFATSKEMATTLINNNTTAEDKTRTQDLRGEFTIIYY